MARTVHVPGRFRAAGEATRPSPGRRADATFVRALERFWRHGDFFPAAAISFYALFSLLPLAILLLVSLQLIFPGDLVTRNMGRLFGGLTDTNILLTTIRSAYAQHGRLGWFGGIALIAAAAGVFNAVQFALNRVWEVPGRRFHLQFLLGVLMMAMSLLMFLGMLLLIATTMRFLRFGEVGALLGHPRLPRSGPTSGLSITTAAAQFAVFWVAYRLLPNVRIRWRDAWLGAFVAAVLWHIIVIGIAWYLAYVSDYSTLYNQVQTIMALIIWVYALACCFLFGAEFVAEWTPYPHVVREVEGLDTPDSSVPEARVAAGRR
ncbi:MAG TPA: YihY/virulence factor BrkB family protein [bacterium]|nr:YihY/virulence factor BrkB family protein [bacterium]